MPRRPTPAPETRAQDDARRSEPGTATADPVREPGRTRVETALPAGSGDGRRVVFSESQQRVWLVDEDEQVQRTYLVSGSVYDNLDPGTTRSTPARSRPGASTTPAG